ncbi:invasion associated locus B family protein [Limibaculum sp. M0105]|uniref:Invasion associated locus B family protein n=1 Tax=Thermohalobaculum xanthum TaxID=2753746 RepID=A0A8J7SCG2_9RHOB|nr:invasion associated locus B family protein [Thermohalobaculum xanthum]MBK0397872.1 invasion associated locus B family protein [Thermohalobaculum xanthum]
MRLLTTLAAATLVAAGLNSASLAQQGQPKEVEKTTHGDWSVRCLEGTDDCRITQIGKNANGQDALLVSLQRISGAKTQNGAAIPAALQVQAPLGVLIPYGVRLKIDDGETAPLGITRCLPIGCVAGAPMTDEAVSLMKKGTTANFSYVLQNETVIKISLKGFTKAYESLTPLPRPTQ